MLNLKWSLSLRPALESIPSLLLGTSAVYLFLLQAHHNLDLTNTMPSISPSELTMDAMTLPDRSLSLSGLQSCELY
jgi:hypothetical protein